MGWYNDWWITGRTLPAGGNDYAVRVTARPLVSTEGRTYVHVGVDGRSTGAEDRKLQVVGRYSWVDATDRGVDGGELTKWYLGVNWWASQQWKAGVGYGVADLLKGGLDGRTGITLVRLQRLS